MKVLITCGPTREYIDDVRYISNASSGRMGAALAREGLSRKHKVRVVAGPVEVPLPRGADVTYVTSALDMLSAVNKNFDWADLVIMAAAVADWRPAVRINGKLKKTSAPDELKLVRNPDILAGLGRKKAGQVLVGFALESDDLLANAHKKLRKKNADLIVANYTSAIGAAKSTVQIIDSTGAVISIGPASKRRIAAGILDAAEKVCKGERR